MRKRVFVVAAVGDLLAQFLLRLPEIVHKTPCVCVAAATTTKKKKKRRRRRLLITMATVVFLLLWVLFFASLFIVHSLDKNSVARSCQRDLFLPSSDVIGSSFARNY